MTVGDVVSGHISIIAGGTEIVQPASGVEFVIHNVYVPRGSNVLVYKTDGITDVLIEQLSSPMLSFNVHVTNDVFVKIVNGDDVNSVLVSYDGIVTKG